jgi:low affinity Fe/Cu permease
VPAVFACTINCVKKPSEKKLKLQQYAIAVTGWVGSTESLLAHTIVFTGFIIVLLLNIFPFNSVLLVFNTAVSLEAIYLALFIQMTVNYTTETIENVEEDIDEIQEDIDEMQGDIDEMQEDVGELQEDVEEMTEEEKEDEMRKSEQKKTLEQLRVDLHRLIQDVEKLQRRS